MYKIGKMKTELHIHTRFSNDSILSFELIKLMCIFKHIDCIAICDHNSIKGGLIAKQKLAKSNIGVIIGEEIFTSDGELIGLFLKEDIIPGLSAEETVNEIHKQGGLVYVPHPYDEKRAKTVLSTKALLNISSLVDLIEIHNGRNINTNYSTVQNNIAEKYTSSSKTIKVCGSDAHTFFELGRNYIVTDSYDTEDPEQFKNALSRGKCNTAHCIILSHTVTKFVKIQKMILKGDFYGIYRTVLRKIKKSNN